MNWSKKECIGKMSTSDELSNRNERKTENKELRSDCGRGETKLDGIGGQSYL